MDDEDAFGQLRRGEVCPEQIAQVFDIGEIGQHIVGIGLGHFETPETNTKSVQSAAIQRA